MATHSPKDQADEVFIFLLASFLGQFGVELFISDISFAASRLVQGLPALVRTAARDQAVERKSCPEPSIPKLSKLSQLSLRKPTMQDPLLRHLQTKPAFREAVPPWFGRRMARHLEEEGANVTFQASGAMRAQAIERRCYVAMSRCADP